MVRRRKSSRFLVLILGTVASLELLSDATVAIARAAVSEFWIRLLSALILLPAVAIAEKLKGKRRRY